MANLTFLATGDSIITRRISRCKDKSFLELQDLIRGVDASFTNIEITTPKDPVIPFSGRSLLSTRPFVLDELAWMGFNLYNVANNHSVDYTFHGLVDTMDELDKRRMVYAGAGRNLGEARRPAYLETAGGRVALIAAATPYATSAWAGWASESRADCPGRPGLNPLRYETRYVLDDKHFEALKDIDEALGTAATSRRQREFGVFFEGKLDAHQFLNANFYRGEKSEVKTIPNEKDVEDIARWIRDAKRQADFVVVSLHAHEGPANDRNSDVAAGFIPEVAHRWIDAGADIFIGHGPHCLRPLEMYKGKPVFQSLGNFLFQTETLDRVPAEVFRGFGLDPHGATPTELFDARANKADGKPRGFHANAMYWQAVLPRCRFENGRITELELYPIDLGLEGPLPERGSPKLADADTGTGILEGFAKMSSPLGADITVEKKGNRVVGRVALS